LAPVAYPMAVYHTAKQDVIFYQHYSLLMAWVGFGTIKNNDKKNNRIVGLISLHFQVRSVLFYGPNLDFKVVLLFNVK